MNTAEKIYRSVQGLPEAQAQEVLHFITSLRLGKNPPLKPPNKTTIAAMQAAERGECEEVTVDELRAC